MEAPRVPGSGERAEYGGAIRVVDTEIRDLLPGYRQRVGLLSEERTGTPSLTLLDRILTDGPERTLIFSTHILEDVKAFAARVWVLHDGRMVENATVAEILHRGGGEDLSAVLYDAIDPPDGG